MINGTVGLNSATHSINIRQKNGNVERKQYCVEIGQQCKTFLVHNVYKLSFENIWAIILIILTRYIVYC